jgi:hypothetical protein
MRKLKWFGPANRLCLSALFSRANLSSPKRILSVWGVWTLGHASQDVGPIRITGFTRDKAVQKMEGERRKGDPEKVELAWQLRSRTTVTLKWIAQRLKMWVWTHVSNCLIQKRKLDQKCQ